jgi:hypothetical protein
VPITLATTLFGLYPVAECCEPGPLNERTRTHVLGQMLGIAAGQGFARDRSRPADANQAVALG